MSNNRKIKCLILYCFIILFIIISCNSDHSDNNPEEIPPTIMSTSPSNGATAVSITSSISIYFSKPMNTASAEAAFNISPDVEGQFSWDTNTMTFNPDNDLSYDTLYTVTISSSASDTLSYTLDSDYIFSFRTEIRSDTRTRYFPETIAGIFIFADQLPSQMVEPLWKFAAENYVGCQKMTLSQIRKLRNYNTNFILLHYRLAHGAGEQAIIRGDQWISYWNDINPHEDWFIHIIRRNQNSGRVENNSWKWYYMDPSGEIEGVTSNGWKEYFVSATIDEMRATECDGLFGDSCGLPFDLTVWPQWLSSTNPLTTWNPHVNSFMKYVHQEYQKTAEKFYFIPNAAAMVTGWDNVTDYSLADGVMVEGFSEWGEGNLDGEYSDWILQMNNCLKLITLDKIVIAQTYPSVNEIKARMFALTCYLLVKGRYTYINLIPDYDNIYWFPEYDLILGSYIAEPPANINNLQNSNGLYIREYQYGWVYVNPADNTISQNLDGNYRRAIPSGGGIVPSNGSKPGLINYQNVSTITLSPGEGAVILKN